MSVDIIEVAAKSENCINCKHTCDDNSANGLECNYPCRLIRIIFGRRPVKANGWCKHFGAIGAQKTQ